MTWKNKGITGLMMVIMAGCTSAPKSPENPYLGYMYFRSIEGEKSFAKAGGDQKLKGYGEQIAEEVFQQRRNQFGDVYNEKSLKKMEEYVALLEQPITIEEEQWKSAAAGLTKKENQALSAYWSANQPFSIDGSKILLDWGSALDNARAQLQVDRGIAKGLELDVDRLRDENRFRNALTKAEELRPYKAEAAAQLVEDIKRDAVDYWVTKRLLEIEGLRKAAVYDGAHEKQIQNLYEAICEDVNAFGHREDFNGVFAGWQDLLGENWRLRIETMGDSKQYWEAYELARDRYRDYVDNVDFAKSYREGLNRKLNKGYIRILDNAIRHYSDEASNACKLKNYDGKAFVYCCMAKEMYDFIIVAGWGAYAGDDAETWYKRLSDLEEKELIPALTARVARRLVIQDFDLDILGLSKKFRQSSLEKYAFGNNYAWAMEVVTAKGALKQYEDGDRQAEPQDYLVEWSRADFNVKGKYGTPIPKTEYVKTGRIRLIENPRDMRKDKNSEFYKLKQVKVQEVDQYSLIETVRGIDLSCNMDVFCSHHGSKEMLQLPITEEGIESINEKFSHVTNITATCSLQNVLSMVKYYGPDTYNNAIPQDEPPSNHIVNIPDEDEFKDALSVTIIKDLNNELERLISLYPIELLPDAVNDKSSRYLDSLGTVLFYVMNLSSTEASRRESAGKGYEWLHLRDQITENMKQWCGPGERWAAAGNSEKAAMMSLWSECVESANELDGH